VVVVVGVAAALPVLVSIMGTDQLMFLLYEDVFENVHWRPSRENLSTAAINE